MSKKLNEILDYIKKTSNITITLDLKPSQEKIDKIREQIKINKELFGK